MERRIDGRIVVAVSLLVWLAACGGGEASAEPPPGVQRATAAQYEWSALTMEPYTVLVDLDAAASPQAALDEFLAGYRWSGRGAEPEVFVRGRDGAAAAAVAASIVAEGASRVFLVE